MLEISAGKVKLQMFDALWHPPSESVLWVLLLLLFVAASAAAVKLKY